MGQTREQKVIKQLTNPASIQKRTAIVTDMFIPNHSGIKSHPEFKDAIVKLVGHHQTIVMTLSRDSSALPVNTPLAMWVAPWNCTITKVTIGYPSNSTLTANVYVGDYSGAAVPTTSIFNIANPAPALINNQMAQVTSFMTSSVTAGQVVCGAVSNAGTRTFLLMTIEVIIT